MTADRKRLEQVHLESHRNERTLTSIHFDKRLVLRAARSDMNWLSAAAGDSGGRVCGRCWWSTGRTLAAESWRAARSSSPGTPH